MPETKPAAVLLRELAAADPERHGQSLARGYGCGPQRIQLRRTKGWRKPASAVTVARPTKWGNPFAVVSCRRTQCGGTKHWHVLDNRDYYEADWALSTVAIVATKEAAIREAIAFYRASLAACPIPADVLAELTGRDLACWCPPGPCHADVLLELANA